MKTRDLQSRNFSLVTYHSEEILKAVLLGVSRIRHFAYIYHDKDKKEDSEELKEPHFHVLLNLNQPMTESAVKKLFPADKTVLTQPMRDKASCWNYLTHEDKPDKFQYEKSLVKCDDLKYWESLQEGGNDQEKYINILRDIISRVPLMDLVERYGRDVIINYDKYRQFAHAVDMEERPFTPPERCVVLRNETGTTIIDGDTGQILCERR